MSEPGDPESSAERPDAAAEEQRTRIIRRAPSGPMPVVKLPDEPATAHIPAPPTRAAGRVPYRSDRTAVAASAVSIVGGWATAVVATDLVAGWWRFNHLFCLAIAFLAVVFAFATVAGVIQLLRRRPIGRWLVVVGAVVALLTYGGLFVAGARVAWIVHALPLLPLAGAALALHPDTKRWLAE